MGQAALEMHAVSKKFRRGELYDSLRDAVPGMLGRLLGRKSHGDAGAASSGPFATFRSQWTVARCWASSGTMAPVKARFSSS